MCDLEKQTFVVLVLTTLDSVHDNKQGYVNLQRNAIVEVAAVKIKKGKIEGHYHSFVAIDGYDAHDIEFGDGNFTYDAKACHLIGAPSFKEVVKKLHDYIGNSLLIVNSLSPSPNNPFIIFKDYARSFGYDFNNPAICMGHILDAARLQKAVEDSGVKFENASTLQIAKMLVYDKVNWTDIFADYDIFFNPDSEDFFDKGRNDPLSWALAFAQLFIKLVEQDDDSLIEPLDDDCPFNV